MKWRLGADLGTNSLGWAAVELDGQNIPTGIVAAGSRIFGSGRDPKSGASLAVDRRDARAMRRRRDRFRQRQAALLKHLTLAGLFPAEQEARTELAGLDPFELRARALREPLPLHHLGRAFFHLNQRRGFKSNRKADRSNDKESGKISIGVSRLRERMMEEGAGTLGEFLHHRRAASTDPNAIAGVRTRLRPETEEGARGDGYDFYPNRQMLEDEFEAIWEAQQPHHPEVLSEEVKDRLFEVIFHQRPLKKPQIGKCTLLGNEERLPKAHPLFQQRRLLEELNALKIVRPGATAEPLALDQRNRLLMKLKDRRSVVFQTLRKELKLDPDARFNKESDNRTDLKGDEVTAELAAVKRFGKRWFHLSLDERWDVVSRIRELESDDDEAMLLAWLRETHGLTPEQAQATVGAHLPEGFGRFGETATRRLISALEAEVIVYSEAVAKSGLGHHSDFRTGEIADELPYYGRALERHIMPGTGEPSDPEEMRVGRLTNPTVHIGLNQLRRVVNCLIRRYGPPAEIAIELARELKLTDEEKQKRNTENNRNREAAERRSKKLLEHGIRDTGANRATLKLWEELNPGNVLDRRCPYSGQQISINMLFSEAVDVDHILPFAQTLDDSNGNKTVCLSGANKLKRNRSPYEAAADFQGRYGDDGSWEAISARAALMPGKRWRFEPDAMEKFRKEDGFLARQLTDTQYLSRLAREYLSALYPDRGEGSSHVWVSPGRLTEMVRRKLGLNDLLPDHNFAGGAGQPKNRSDHRHHAIDAAVIAIVDRSMLQAIARASGEEGVGGRERIIIPDPWEGFRDDLRNAVNAIVVSHRPDHGTAGAGKDRTHDTTAGRLHNDTAYGLTSEKDANGNEIVVHRVPLDTLKTPGSLESVRDDALRAALQAWTGGFEGKAFEERIRKFPDLGPLPFRKIRRLRVTEPMATRALVKIGGEKPYKAYKGGSNFRYDVWETGDGKWTAEVISMFEALQPGWTSKIRAANPTARKVLSLKQGDLLATDNGTGDVRLFRVVKFTQNGQITLAEPQESNTDERAKDKDDPFKFFAPTGGGLKKLMARQVRIDELGRVLDPGYPARKRVRKTRPK